MRFLTLAQYQRHLASHPTHFESYKSFISTARVRLFNGSIVSLAEYRRDYPHIRAADLRNLYDHILTHGEYITKFYNASLNVSAENIINAETTAPMNLGNINNSTESRFKNPVRNMFWREILRETRTDFRGQPYLTALEDLYKHNIINHNILARAALKYLEDGQFSNVLSFYFFRASIMNPYVVYSLQMRTIHARRVFTPTLGWGSYFHGFVAGGIQEYVGVDVIQNVCKKVAEYAAEFHPEVKTRILCQPSESLLRTASFLREYRRHFDTAFCSPPYYRLELYNGGKQSTEEYPSYEAWLEGYWRATVQVCHIVLAAGGTFCYILGDYKDRGGVNYPLLEDMGRIAREVGFTHKRTIPMQNRDTSKEKIVVFIK